MTTQHMQHEHNDGDAPVVESQHVSETLISPTPLADTLPVAGQAREQDESFVFQNEEQQDNHQPDEKGGDEVRPFTAFIEEFQQSEGYPSPSQQELSADTFAALISETVPTSQPGVDFPTPGFDASWQSVAAPESGNIQIQEVVETLEVGEPGESEEPAVAAALEEIPAASPAGDEEVAAPELPTASAEAQIVTAERPVSPLLRPASRIRMPRHGTRHRDEAHRQEAPAPVPVTTSEAPVEASTPPETVAEAATAKPETSGASETPEAPVELPAQGVAGQEQVPAAPARPPRRYRFDRPATNAYAPATSVPTPRVEEHKEVASRVTAPAPAQSENEPLSNGHSQREENAAGLQAQQKQSQPQAEAPATKAPASGEEAGTVQAVTNGEHERRRRHSQERQREKEQSVTASQTSAEPEVQQQQQPAAASQVEPAAAQAEAVNPEDLPPLEYAELQAASSRRRRRRRTAVGTNGTPTAPATKATETTAPVPAPTPIPAAPVAPPRVNAAATQYNIVSGYTVNQMNQNGDGGPFMGPEPSPARGSLPTQAGRSVRAEVQRAPAYPPVRETSGASAASVRHLAETVAQAIQAQTDRMVAELRRANQGPTNVSVTLPPFPSTERVGVFVDVANLLYSARTMRINIDFGKLLDFLRGNRRLVRAHAYCPTSPQPGDEQMFLQAVKGLGYRITTKNYKTFSSGAKKADLDLDLCMDVVRLVDGRAVDCVVLVSGDSDFMPMLDYCSDHGVRVEVAAFDEAMSATLRQSCDLFINLSMLEEIRA